MTLCALARPLGLLLLLALSVGCDSGGVTSGDGRIYAGGRYFGKYLALDGETALVSAYDTDEAFVIQHSDSEWKTRARLSPPMTCSP